MRWPPPQDWPNAHLSRQIHCPPHRWHVQETGTGGTVLLLHGAGGSTHSFRDLIPLLAKAYHVVAIDLPGQGFTQLGARHRSSLNAMAEDVEKLCAHEGWQPVAIVGHSAGGALALRLSQTILSPRGQSPKVIGINPALDHFEGIAGVLFPVMAKLLAAVPFTAHVFSRASKSPRRVKSLIDSTGSVLDSDGLALYQQLVGDRDHADATLLMMAQWQLETLLDDLGSVPAGTSFIVGDLDRTVPPKVADKAAAKIPDAQVIRLPGLGHLAHEEAPDLVAGRILQILSE